MRNKMKKFLNWYLFCLLIFLFIIIAIGFTVGPLLLGLFASPYLFFLYILSLFAVPVVIMLFIMIPDLYECIVVDGILFS